KKVSEEDVNELPEVDHHKEGPEVSNVGARFQPEI
ncbi:hypothetical protein AVEN_62051-1, partial [Araneus ventricosus]